MYYYRIKSNVKNVKINIYYNQIQKFVGLKVVLKIVK